MERHTGLIEWGLEQVMQIWQDQNVKDIFYQPSIQKHQPYSEVIVTFVNGCDEGYENYEQALKMVGRSMDVAIKNRG